MKTQACPNCNRAHDIGVYVTGQKILCGCGIHFEVRRTDVTVSGRVPANGAPGSARAGPAAKTEPTDEALTADQTFIGSGCPEIPGYELREILGKGGMGEVWRGVQQSLEREVAIKLLPPKLAKDPEFITRFEKEATALASLSHPNVIQIIDRGRVGDHYYFVMEYVAGRTLRELINAGNLPAQDALKIIAQVCRAIDYAHEKQIIHRDLKPENILIDERGNVKVADFGLAGIRQSEPRLHLTATAVAMGTVNYMAPEQRRDAKNVDGRADLYSLGVILYELLTGDLPLGRFKLPSEKGLDIRVDHIVLKSLETDPNARYQRASAIGMELEQLIESSSGRPYQPDSRSAGAPPETAAGTEPRAQSSSARRAIQTSWRGVRVALMGVGAVAVLSVLVRLWVGPVSLKVEEKNGDALVIGGAGINVLHKKHDHAGPGRYPPNTNAAVFSASTWKDSGDGRGELTLEFDKGKEEINAHAGSWKLEDGKLKATQAGSETGGQKLIPRAYVSQRYFSSDDLTAEVDLTLRELEDDFPTEENAQHFGELAFRIKDVQVSIFAIDRVGMRLLWRYFTPDGAEVSGNSARDLENLVEDEMPVPPSGTTFTVKLAMKKRRNGTEVDAFVNGQRFAKKLLIGFEGRLGKVALGCRNQHCEFDNLKVRGKFEGRAPATRLADTQLE